MIIREFPDLHWLKQRIQQAEPWPHCVLNVKTMQSWRPDVRGPVSLFVNLKGFSHCEVENRRTLIAQDRYFLTCAGDRYGLEIDNPQGTETLNIHFAEGFAETIYTAWTERLPQEPLLFFNHSFARTPEFNSLILRFYQDIQRGCESASEEEWLSLLMLFLLKTHDETFAHYAALPVQKQKTSQSLYRQLSWSIDYMHTFYSRKITLEDMASVACMSKYHYLRFFRALTGATPYQFLRKLRIEKVCAYLQQKTLSLQHIATLTGFESLSALSRSFRDVTGVSPTFYKSQICP